MQVTVLGCGPSTGVPVIGNKWLHCDPNNPKNARLRPSIFIEVNGYNILVDTSPDMRQQLLSIDCQRIDAVFYTHSHADHTHGINDLRNVNKLMKAAIPIYADQKTMDDLKTCFAYIFQPDSKKAFFKPLLEENLIEGDFHFKDIPVTVIQQSHGVAGDTLGFRIGDFAYCTDVVDFPEGEFEKLRGIKTWIVDCFRETPHPTHAHMQKVIDWVEELGVAKTYLTHMCHELDYDKTCRKLPNHIRPSYDGLKIIVD